MIVLIASIFARSHQQSLLESIFNFLQEGGVEQSAEPKDTRIFLPEYDFIIIGAGTAGCVVANRLSENPNWNVLLLEAGRSENYIMDLPILANYLQFTDANWKYNTVPSQKYCLGMDNSQCNWPRGKVMGGSSVLNYMIYTRGNHRDFDNWASKGNEGWSFADVLPYYKKIENFTIPEYQDPKYHSNDGYLTIGYAPFHTKLAESIVKASEEYGMNYVDYNGATQTGVSYLQVTQKDGVRASSSRAYLHPIRNRPNFQVRKQAMVKKIMIDPETKQVQGVEVMINNMAYQIRAKREVIVSAGAINSPQLLMLSGIGPKKHLTQVGIPVIKNAKVGYNLMDHIAAGGLTFTIDKPLSIRTNDVLQRDPLVNFLSHHKGPLTLPGGCEVLSLVDLKNQNDPDGYPDMELLYQAGSIVSDPLLRKNFGITDAIYDSMYKPIEGNHSYMVLPMLLLPKSKGRMVLQNNDYRSKPFIFPNYFAHQDDVDTLVAGIKLAINISEQPALREIGARLHKLPLPACAHHGFGTDKYWECHIRHFTFTIYHQSGTCKMGPKTDKNAVVDPRLRVYGVQGLRVVDASIIPEVPAAHTNAPVFMIAEKGADMIKEDWKGR